MARVGLVACVGKKRPDPSPAEQLYASPLFEKSREFAKDTCDRWFILSAMHGLVAPATVIEPYEVTLNRMPAAQRAMWSHRVFKQLTSATQPHDDIVVLAGLKYRERLLPLLRERGHRVSVPMEGMSIGKQLQWLNQQLTSSSRRDLETFYSLLDRLAEGIGGTRVLGECTGRLDWPERGVYFLREPGELRSAPSSTFRIVRVGTHMVSRGSKASLWSRLRTHRGHASGTGNHRGSILRRHVGDAIMRRAGREKGFPTWGRGSSAPREVVESEALLEREVSSYIGQMQVLWLPVMDEAGPVSDRAFLERNSIALLAPGGTHAERPSAGWLGNFSARNTIRDSGLWNVDHVGYEFDQGFIDILRQYVDMAVAGMTPPTASIARRK